MLLGALLIGVVWISLSFFLANERNSAERAEVQNSTNLAGALASHLSNSLGEVDRTLSVITTLYDQRPDFDLLGSLKTNRSLSHEMIKQAADQLQTSLRDHSSDFAAARAHIEELHKKGQLTETRLCRFAELGKFDETVVALSLLAELPVGAIERALVHDTGDQVLVLAKSINLSWRTTRAVLGVRSGAHGEFPEYHAVPQPCEPGAARMSQGPRGADRNPAEG